MSFLRSQLLLVVILGALLGSWFWPEPGQWLYGLKPVNALLCVIFLCQGFSLDHRSLRLKKKLILLLCLGTMLSLVFSPFLALVLSKQLSLGGDAWVGFLMMSAMAPTLVSGVVMSVRAGGDRMTALMLTLVVNLGGILVIPFTLSWCLGENVELNRYKLLFKLVAFVLVPTFSGAVLGALWPKFKSDFQSWLRLIPIFALGVILYVSCSHQTGIWKTLPLEDALYWVVISVGFHLFLLLLAWSLASLIKADRAEKISFSILCSQKTLPIAMAVWTISFKESYPLAIAFPILFHFSQLCIDSLILSFWKNKE